MNVKGAQRVAQTAQPVLTPRKRTVCIGYSLVSMFGFLLLLMSPATSSYLPETLPARDTFHALSKYAIDAAAPILHPFQVYTPLLEPVGNKAELTDGYSTPYPVNENLKTNGCVRTQTLMVHTFANSYGQPFVGSYTPPDCDFNTVVFNLTVSAAGRQFDRIALAYFGATEIWRTSTAEPTSTGIEWTYLKDMSSFLTLFKESQTLVFDLGNLVNNIYTAPYHATLTAKFFTADKALDAADRIFSVSQGNTNNASVFQVPPMPARESLTLPRNIRKAIFSISATGQIDEEFWYGNVLNNYTQTFGKSVTLYPKSPFREVQLFIDGKLAGVVWPFPVIFTGGVVPGLWRPIVGITTFDLKEDEIDITPWLGLLCDGNPHTFRVRIAGIQEDGGGKGSLTKFAGSYWLVTGKIFVWLDKAGSITKGSLPTRNVADPSITLSNSVGKNNKGVNETYTANLSVSRRLSISGAIKTASGRQTYTWTQKLTYTNRNLFTDYGNTQSIMQSTEGTDISSNNYARKISYPVVVNSTYTPRGKDFTLTGAVDYGQDIQFFGQPVFPTGLLSFENVPNTESFQGSILQTTLSGSGVYRTSNKGQSATSSGSTQQDFTFSGITYNGQTTSEAFPTEKSRQELYYRSVAAKNASVTTDNERFFGKDVTQRSQQAQGSDVGTFAWAPDAQKLIGRLIPPIS